jgi:uncharacterized protein
MRVPRTTIESGGHIAFEIESGQRLTIAQPLGEQVADLISFTRDDPRERLSMLASRATQLSYKLTKGHKLYSSRTREMWDIEEDLTGENYCGGGYCSRHLNMVRYNLSDTPNCEDNLEAGILQWGLDRYSFSPDVCFNIFMTVAYDADGKWEIRKPLGKAGDYMVLRALQPQYVSISNCPMTLNACNNYKLKPLEIEVA